MKNGVPYEVAAEMSDAERFAHSVVFAEFEGQEFDWHSLRFVKKKSP